MNDENVVYMDYRCFIPEHEQLLRDAINNMIDVRQAVFIGTDIPKFDMMDYDKVYFLGVKLVDNTIAVKTSFNPLNMDLSYIKKHYYLSPCYMDNGDNTIRLISLVLMMKED